MLAETKPLKDLRRNCSKEKNDEYLIWESKKWPEDLIWSLIAISKIENISQKLINITNNSV